jgi:formylglycine-generating enzyme required for sulfatase activity
MDALQGWLEPERARLEVLRSLQVDALTWDRNGRDAAFLNHRDRRLVEAAALAGIEAYRKRLRSLELDYLAACEAAERSARRRTRRMQALVGLLVAAVLAGLAAWRYERPLKEQVYWFTEVRGHVLTAEQVRALKPNDAFRECTDCPEMIVVPAGSFMMGSPATERGRDDRESPQHEVRFTKPFAVARFDVTFDEWDACAAQGDCDPHINDRGWGRGRQPVIYVNWDDAQQYVAWLSRVTGRPYRLLTEAEWEYAARAGTKTTYYWGDEIGKGNANCAGCGSQWDSRQPAPVGSFAPNAFGLYDMAGNLEQWVQDCSHYDYKGAPADGSAWVSGDCYDRVLRGGSWVDGPELLRSADRAGILLDSRSYIYGFRVARTLLP